MNTPPIVTIVSPSHMATVSGPTQVKIKIQAGNLPTGDIYGQLGGKTNAMMYGTIQNQTDFSFYFDSKLYPNGPIELKIVAYMTGDPYTPGQASTYITINN